MTGARRQLEASPRPLAECFDVALLDLDGVVYVGPSAVPGAQEHLRRAAAAGMRLAYVTNNASRTPDVVAAHLRELGMPAHDADVVTSAQAAARVLTTLVSPGARVLVVGGAGLVAALQERGLVPVGSADDDPAAVVQGFSPDIGWALLAEGAYALERGVPWVASNTDLTIPTTRGRAPGNGTLVQVLRTATGREPLVAGKPETPMHAEAVARTGARRPLVVGDRLDTDIEGANRAGVPSLLVFSGVTDPAHVVLAAEPLRPAFLADDLGGLHESHPETTADGSGWACGEARAEVVAAELVVAATGARLDRVRAACAAAWTYGVLRLDPDATRRCLAAVLR
jgi:HAD superfamily hydrolase (TIGR01450 family)